MQEVIKQWAKVPSNIYVMFTVSTPDNDVTQDNSLSVYYAMGD